MSYLSDKLAQSSDARLLMLIVFYVGYLFFGALVFDALESPHEARIINELNEFVRRFRQVHNSCLTDDELNEFIKIVSQANDKGVPATANVTKEPNWSFGQAVFFSGTVLTTIGYGDVTVQTQLGKCFCILFALIGIPVTLLLLYAIIERLMCVTQYAKEIFVETMQPVFNKMGLFNYSLQRSHMHVSFAIMCALVVLVVFLLIPAHVYAFIEQWEFLNAFYYCFISLSTVGLGDYVPGDDIYQAHCHFYKICSTLYLIIGVTAMVWLLQIFSETPEFNLYKYFSLNKDAILTSHRDTIHTMSGGSGPGDYPFRSGGGSGGTGLGISGFGIGGGAGSGGIGSKEAEAKIGYNDLNREMSHDDELILTNSSSAQQAQNYLSLNEVDGPSSSSATVVNR